jgi:hypothetical protein
MKTRLILLLLITSIISFAQNPNLLVEETFEGSTYLPNSGSSIDKIRSYENCNPSAKNTNGDIEHGTLYDWTLKRVTDNVYAGSKSVQFEVQKDQPLVGGSQRIRSEVVIISGKEDPRWTPDCWYSFAVRFPSAGMESDSLAAETLNQWWEDGGNDNVIRIKSNKVFFEGTQPTGYDLPLYDLFKVTAYTGPVAIGTGTTSIDKMVPIIKDKWVHFVFHFVHSFGSDGLTEIWRDGLKIYEIKGPNMHAGIPKWKIGLYKASYPKSIRPFRRVYFDDVRVGKQGSTLADMMPDAPPTSTTVPVLNKIPVAKAGPDVVITLPANSVTLNGSASDSDGNITMVAWDVISGNNVTIDNVNVLDPVVQFASAGTYTFRLTVSDDKGEIAMDDVSVVVNREPNKIPLVSAGNDLAITLPTNSILLNGIVGDPDGLITKAQWTQITGLPATILSTDGLSTMVSGLTQGLNTFRLTVTDDSGATAFDECNITVNAAPLPPPPPAGITSFVLRNAETEKDIATITNGAGFSILKVGKKLTIRANTAGNVTSVKFELSGKQSKTVTDKAVPFALWGDNGRGDYWYGSWSPPAIGSYTLKATPYSGGVAATPVIIKFSFIK